jgi:hypothetical protein
MNIQHKIPRLIMYDGKSCGSIHISPEIIFTAAHCVFNTQQRWSTYNNDPVTIRQHTKNIDSNNFKTRNFEEIYSQDLDSGIVVLNNNDDKIDTQNIFLLTNPEDLPEGMVVKFYGNLSGEHDIRVSKQNIHAQIKELTGFNQANHPDFITYANTIKLFEQKTYFKLDSGIKAGDSGSPIGVFFDNDRNFAIIGNFESGGGFDHDIKIDINCINISNFIQFINRLYPAINLQLVTYDTINKSFIKNIKNNKKKPKSDNQFKKSNKKQKEKLIKQTIKQIYNIDLKDEEIQLLIDETTKTYLTEILKITDFTDRPTIVDITDYYAKIKKLELQYFEDLLKNQKKKLIKKLIKELDGSDIKDHVLDAIIQPNQTIDEIINNYLDATNRDIYDNIIEFKDFSIAAKKLEIKKEINKNNIIIDDALLDNIIREKITKEAIMNEIYKKNASLFPTNISKLIISVLILSLTGLLISGYKIDYKTIKKYIMFTLIILIFEYYRGNNLLGGGRNRLSTNLLGGSLDSQDLFTNITDINKFYDVYKQNYLQKVNIKNINVSSYIQNFNNYFNLNKSNENKIIFTALSFFDLSDISKEVESEILNLNKGDTKTKSDVDFKYEDEKEDINIDEKEIYNQYKEITASLTGNLSKKSKELLLKKIKDLEILKKKINNQYNEIIEYTKLLSGINKNNIMNLDNTLSEQTIHDYVTNYKKLIKKENKNTQNFKLILQTL